MKGLPFEYKAIHLLNNGGEQNSAEYQKVNPAREVPSLVHNGKVITQSVAIIEYLDEVFPKPRLYPADPVRKALVRQFCETINCTHPLHNLKVLQYLEKNLNAQEAQKNAWTTEWVQRCFQTLEKMVSTTAGKYCFGDEVTTADLFLVPQILTAKRFSIDYSKYSLLSRIHENCLKLEAFQKAHPQAQPDTPSELVGKL